MKPEFTLESIRASIAVMGINCEVRHVEACRPEIEIMFTDMGGVSPERAMDMIRRTKVPIFMAVTFIMRVKLDA